MHFSPPPQPPTPSGIDPTFENLMRTLANPNFLNPPWEHPANAPTAARPANSSAGPARPANSHKRPHETAFPNNPYRKRDDRRNPRNVEEESLLKKLQSIGFRDAVEILDTIRRLQTENDDEFPTLDQVSVEIVKQREEAYDAAQMDRARLESEKSRKAEAAARRAQAEKEFQDLLWSSSMEQWKSDAKMFPQSWLLRSRVAPRLERKLKSCKKNLLTLLQLEKKARRWYQRNLPFGYFGVSLVETLEKSRDVNETLSLEIDLLQKGMYSLSEQRGGVPRMLLLAHERAVARGLVQTDDEVQVVGLLDQENAQDVIEID